MSIKFKYLGLGIKRYIDHLKNLISSCFLIHTFKVSKLKLFCESLIIDTQ